MARIARIIAAGIPHHIIQRGNRRMQTFFSEEDYEAYIRLMGDWCQKFGTEIWTYCLMPKHVHHREKWQMALDPIDQARSDGRRSGRSWQTVGTET